MLLAEAVTGIFFGLMFCLSCVCWRYRKLNNQYEEITNNSRTNDPYDDGIVRTAPKAGNARRRIIADPETHGVLTPEEREAQELTEIELKDCKIEFD